MLVSMLICQPWKSTISNLLSEWLTMGKVRSGTGGVVDAGEIVRLFLQLRIAFIKAKLKG
jgi:hypothetical protein